MHPLSCSTLKNAIIAGVILLGVRQEMMAEIQIGLRIENIHVGLVCAVSSPVTT